MLELLPPLLPSSELASNGRMLVISSRVSVLLPTFSVGEPLLIVTLPTVPETELPARIGSLDLHADHRAGIAEILSRLHSCQGRVELLGGADLAHLGDFRAAFGRCSSDWLDPGFVVR